VAQGHVETQFASGQSITAARLAACCSQPLRLNSAVRDTTPYYMVMLDKVRSMASEYDIPAFSHRPISFLHLPRNDTSIGHKPARTPRSAGPEGSLYASFPGHEVIDEGVTGCVVADAAIRTLARVLALVRRRFEERFTVTRMAQDYVKSHIFLPPASAPVSSRPLAVTRPAHRALQNISAEARRH
jgi:hypothetical protein